MGISDSFASIRKFIPYLYYEMFKRGGCLSSYTRAVKPPSQHSVKVKTLDGG